MTAGDVLRTGALGLRTRRARAALSALGHRSAEIIRLPRRHGEFLFPWFDIASAVRNRRSSFVPRFRLPHCRRQAALRTSFSTLPSRMWMMRCAWSAMSASCVTRTIVLPV